MDRSLKSENLTLKTSLQEKVVLFNEIITPGFNFGIVIREQNPKEYFASNVLNKIYSLNVSMENSLKSNDVFLSIYLYRYIYELYIKTFYIFSGSTETQILSRLDEFFENKDWKFKKILNQVNDTLLPSNFKLAHEQKYRAICRFVHPNHESFKLHINRTDDQQFEFMVPNINLTIWHSVAIIRLFSNLSILNFNQNINQLNLVSLQNEYE